MTSSPTDSQILDFPRALSSYTDYSAVQGTDLFDTIVSRVHAEPFNLVATIIFLLAIIHTFMTSRFRHWAHEVEIEHRKKLSARGPLPEPLDTYDDETSLNPDEVSFKGQILHFLGEIEAVFGIWGIIYVGVELACLASKGTLNRLPVSITGDLKHFIVINLY